MQNYIILKNAIQCNKCKDVIESTHRHDFVTCSCGSCSVDGGRDYMRRLGTPEDYTDVSEVKFLESNFEELREILTWGTRGETGSNEIKRIPVAELTTKHIEGILSTQWHIKGTVMQEVLQKELDYRKGKVHDNV